MKLVRRMGKYLLQIFHRSHLTGGGVGMNLMDQPHKDGGGRTCGGRYPIASRNCRTIYYKTIKRTVIMGIVGLVLGLHGFHPHYAQKIEAAERENYELKVHHFLSTKAVTHKDLLLPWAEKITEASGGELQLTIYPAMQLGGRAPQLFDQARRGTVDIAWTLAGYTPNRFPRMEVFELPFMAADARSTSQAAYEFYTKFATEDFKDVKVLLVHAHAPGKFHMNNRPIRNLADLRGAKIRAPSRLTNIMLEELGATAVGMPVPDLPPALAKGVVDGALVPYEVSLPLRLHELTNSHTDIAGDRGLYTAIFILVMNQRKFDSLPPRLQRILEENSGLGWAGEAGELWDRSDLPGIEAARDAGDTFYQIEDDELDRWKVIGNRVRDNWAREMTRKGIDGRELIERAEELISKYENQSKS